MRPYYFLHLLHSLVYRERRETGEGFVCLFKCQVHGNIYFKKEIRHRVLIFIQIVTHLIFLNSFLHPFIHQIFIQHPLCADIILGAIERKESHIVEEARETEAKLSFGKPTGYFRKHSTPRALQTVGATYMYVILNYNHKNNFSSLIQQHINMPTEYRST